MRPYCRTSDESALFGPWDGLVGGQSEPSLGVKSGSSNSSPCACLGVKVQASASTWQVPQVRPFVPRLAKKPLVLPVPKALVESLPKTPEASSVSCVVSESPSLAASAEWETGRARNVRTMATESSIRTIDLLCRDRRGLSTALYGRLTVAVKQIPLAASLLRTRA